MEQLRRHNLHLVLRAIYSGGATSRAEVAVVTGLTKPTVSTLVSDLLTEGYISERGPGRSGESGGKRPTLLSFEPRARQVIGISVVGRRVLGVLTDLAGETTALHVRETEHVGGGADVGDAIGDVVAGLLPQLDARLLGIGAGLPGGGASPDLRRLLTDRFGVGVHLGNQAELSALGQLAYADGVDRGTTLVNLIVDRVVEIGVGIAGGAIHYGSDLGTLRLAGGRGSVLERLGWEAVRPRLESLLQAGPGVPGPSYLRLRDAASRGDDRAARFISELAGELATVLAWLVVTLRPGQVSLGGRLGDLGQPFLDLVRSSAEELLPAAQLDDVRLTLAYTDQLGAMGAAALVIQAELELLQP
jgi:predicted NBD/HSP70 family sugar kinase